MSAEQLLHIQNWILHKEQQKLRPAGKVWKYTILTDQLKPTVTDILVIQLKSVSVLKQPVHWEERLWRHHWLNMLNQISGHISN